MSSADRRTTSFPPERRPTLSDQISSIGARLNRALSRGRSPERPARDFDNQSLASSTATVVSTQGVLSNERSVSRGREGLRRSSGRGGLGNIVAPSVPENATLTMEHSVSPTRGRDDSTSRSSRPIPIPFSSTGRGGAGNIRQPSQEQFDSDTITLVSSRDADAAVRSASQTSPSRTRLSTGRGGIGNIKRNPAVDSNTSQEEAALSEGSDGPNNHTRRV
ncbi:hypothetical protein BT96DRAFT_385652 [Gymnopus androsaceus JB14]|uniref:Uncharacterized protein n=1 Tax=Gymnopus androsaceus JB14 TaxID=1447944 RepID=A0A6A4I2H8_9AGAR|nr:hypothetical protein BT96DRAFT_385652 [Gymnopus androsaceus JB14]